MLAEPASTTPRPVRLAVGTGFRCRSRPRRWPDWTHAFLVLTALGFLVADACNVPVFRYALERWEAEPYAVLVFHRGPFEDEGTKALGLLESAATNHFANVIIRRIDLSIEINEPDAREWWSRQTNATPPWLVAVFPNAPSEMPAAWAGALSITNVQRLLDSPSRRELSRRLMAGESAVWLLLESGDRSADDALTSRLERELSDLEPKIQLPPAAPDDPQMHAPLPLEIAFSVLRVSRNDPAEAPFASLLLGSGPGLATNKAPVAFPIFGRGRLLAPVPGPQITAELIGEASDFVCGPCTCEFKGMNPGCDLLLTANWDSIFDQPPPAIVQRALPLPVIAPGPATTTSVATPSPPAPPPANESPISRKLILAGALASLLLVVWTGSRLFSKSNRGQS
jgi:hypothetical protein